MFDVLYKQRRNLTGMLAVIAALLLMQITSVAQSDQGRITGTVRDQAGAVVPGAQVTVQNERTGDERTAATNAVGYYQIAALRPSFYTVKITAPNFAGQEIKSAQVLVGQALTLDVDLKPASTTETVNVVGGNDVAIDTASATMGVNVNPREVQSLPLNGRQVSQLYLQAPGALNSGSGTFGDIRFNGRAVEQNIIRYDGIEGTAIIDAALATSTVKCRRPSACNLPWRMYRSFASNPAGTPPSSALAPAGRSV